MAQAFTLAIAEWGPVIGLFVTALLAAVAALLGLSALSLRGRPAVPSVFAAPTPATVLLFDGETLVDATPPGRALLHSGTPGGSALFRALSRLEPMFPGLRLRLEGLQREGRFILCAREDLSPPVMLRAEWLGGLTRLTLVESDAGPHPASGDGAAEAALAGELADLRDMLARAPMPIWRETGDGAVVWANSDYLAAAVQGLAAGQELSWPLPAIFGPDPSRRTAEGAAPQRRMLDLEKGRRWYEVQALPAGSDRICFALPADRLVKAETSLRDFKQTLTKTFAHLPIGLAIFDRNRVLQLFNPALIDLTGLSAEFLIARPTLSMLLDAMREAAMLPEPRDYRSWRRQIVDMETAAASGLFQDTWSLPSGQTYRVTGRPHPDGALAFLIEDISTEMTRTRRYRADLELGQAVIDAMADAIVVFAQDGAVAMVNAAAQVLWGPEITPGLTEASPEPEAIALFRRMTAPTLLWAELSSYIGSFGPRDAWEGDLRLLDGRALDCRISPMPHGSTLVSFRITGAYPALLGETLGVRLA